ncbi:MAG: hypothetical protein HQK82_14125, partial [Desulfovibrionaceae bacterium]|nr:hypothetical protein [Desulfovibrionaceae bacterium]
MAKILYGVHGTSHGHAVRAVTLARHFREHEFLFVTSEDALRHLSREFPVIEVLNPGTRYKNYQVDMPATLALAAKTLARRERQIRKVAAAVEDFKPDACISDYEYFVPLAARRCGLSCLSLDHQHVITGCRHDIPAGQYLDYLGIAASIKFLFSAAPDTLIISFFRPPLKSAARTRICAPLHRESVFEHAPAKGGHILVYQSCSVCDAFAPFLKTSGRECRIYGYNVDKTEGNLTFRSYSEQGLLADLASCAYVVCGGSHSLISEALYYGKPVMSFPVKGAFEQWINASYVEKLGYGRHLDMHALDARLFPGFEERLGEYEKNVAAGEFRGNETVFVEFIAQRTHGDAEQFG